MTKGERAMSDTFTTEDEQLVTAAAVSNRPVQAGDIFEASWGYDQTNIDYYLVQSVTASGKSVRLVKIGQTLTDQGGRFGDHVIPDPSRVLSTPTLHRIGTGWRGQPSIKVRDWGVWASPWSGGSRYQTAPGFGH